MLFKTLFAPAPPATPLTKFIFWNGIIYMSSGFLFLFWPDALHVVFGAPELPDPITKGYVRAVGIATTQIGYFYLWGARTRSERFCLSTLLNRWFAPFLIMPWVFAGVLEPRLGIPFSIIDPVLAFGAYMVWRRTSGKTADGTAPAVA